MKTRLRDALMTTTSASLFVLALCATPYDAAAVQGGGITPIGEPVQALNTLVLEQGKFSGQCELLASNEENVTLVQTRSSPTQPSVDVSESFDGVLGTDDLNLHSDATGTFWATAISRGRNHNEERPRIEGQVFWTQAFTKDTANAYVHFTVTSAQLSVWQAPDAAFRAGACARIDAQVTLLTDDVQIDSFVESALLNMQESPKPGPMTFTETTEKINGYDKHTFIFDKYHGNVDLSAVDVGQQFEVLFITSAVAGSGFSEFPAENIASYRDPLTFGGGITIEVDGATPLNNAHAAPIPRDQTHAQAIQADGKLVSAGFSFNGKNLDFAVARYLPDGNLDSSFHGDGKVTTDVGGADDQANAVALQPDGKILVAGRAGNGRNDDLAVVRYNADGSLDGSFGSGGKVQLDVAGFGDSAQAIAVQADGKILIAGYSGRGTQDTVLARLNTDGSRDASGFGTNGVVTTDFAGNADFARAVALQADGRIVIAGYSDLGSASTRTDFALARYNSDGTPDSSFGAGGKVTTDFGGGDDYAEALALQPDGKLVVAGHLFVNGTADFALARYNADGTLDTAFGTQGKVTSDLASDNDYAYALALQSDGKLVVGGYTAGETRDFAVVRYTQTGALDPQFGSNGTVQVDIAGKDDQAHTVSIQSDGKIVVAGWAATSMGDDFAMVRLNP
jgi:uncharacterized delta-60 repeat protein